MPGKDVIELLVEGGKAGPDASSAQKLSAYKLNIGDVFKKVNEKTANYQGMEVPVKIIIDKDTKEYDIEVGTPPVSSMIKKEIGIEKAKVETEEEEEVEVEMTKTVMGEVEKIGEVGEGERAGEVEEKVGESEEVEKVEKLAEGGEEKEEKVVLGSISMEQCVKIAKMKMDNMLVKNLKSAVKQVIGTAVSMQGIEVEEKPPKEVIKEVEEGKWDHLFKE